MITGHVVMCVRNPRKSIIKAGPNAGKEHNDLGAFLVGCGSKGEKVYHATVQPDGTVKLKRAELPLPQMRGSR